MLGRVGFALKRRGSLSGGGGGGMASAAREARFSIDSNASVDRGVEACSDVGRTPRAAPVSASADAVAERVEALLGARLEGLQGEVQAIGTRLAALEQHMAHGQEYHRWIRGSVEDVVEKVERMSEVVLEHRFG